MRGRIEPLGHVTLSFLVDWTSIHTLILTLNEWTWTHTKYDKLLFQIDHISKKYIIDKLIFTWVANLILSS